MRDRAEPWRKTEKGMKIWRNWRSPRSSNAYEMRQPLPTPSRNGKDAEIGEKRRTMFDYGREKAGTGQAVKNFHWVPNRPHHGGLCFKSMFRDGFFIFFCFRRREKREPANKALNFIVIAGSVCKWRSQLDTERISKFHKAPNDNVVCNIKMLILIEKVLNA